jgi:hypothetical protein
MAFFQRIVSYIANEVIVNGLANKCGGGGSLRRHAHAAAARRFSASPSAPMRL